MKNKLIITLLLFTTVFLFGESEPARKALVVGNSTYEAGALTNPVNDAVAIAKVLENAGFEVILTTNRNSGQMESDLDSFIQNINKNDIALFFYAGHGVQVDGLNYLLPVDNKGISNNSALKRRAIDAQDYVTAMADAGASLNIVILDACRDNPLPSVSRSGSRGLAVMSAPGDTETVIVYATKAGDVAEDGEGSNSTFTTAFLEVVNTPDLDLLLMFNEVGTKVRQNTNGDQTPTIYTEPLSRSFTFFSSKKQAEEARQASNKAMAEVEAMEVKIATLQAQARKAKNDKEKQEIELEQKRQEALLAAQLLQAENLSAEADRRAVEAARSETEAKQRAIDSANASERQDELAKLAAKRREELEQLSRDAESEDPDVLIATIERLKTVLGEIEAEYDKAWQSTLKEIEKSFLVRLDTLKKQKTEIWETDDDFAIRIKNETAALTKEQNQLTTERKNESKSLLNNQTATIRSQLKDALSILDTRTWTLSGSEVELEVGEYDRNNQIWAFTLKSNNKGFPVWPITLSVDLSQSSKDEIIALDEAVKSDAIMGTIEWSIKPIGDKYGVDYEGSKLTNIIENKDIITNIADETNLVATFSADSRQKLQIAWTKLMLFGGDNIQRAIVNGEEIVQQGTIITSNKRIFQIDVQSKSDGKWYPMDKKVDWGKISEVNLNIPKEPKNIFLGGTHFDLGIGGVGAWSDNQIYSMYHYMILGIDAYYFHNTSTKKDYILPLLGLDFIYLYDGGLNDNVENPRPSEYFDTDFRIDITPGIQVGLKNVKLLFTNLTFKTGPSISITGRNSWKFSLEGFLEFYKVGIQYNTDGSFGLMAGLQLPYLIPLRKMKVNQEPRSFNQ